MKALEEIYNIYILLHRSELKVSAKMRPFFVALSKMNFAKKNEREGEGERLICLTSPDPQKAAACGKRHASADQWTSPLGRTKNRELEKKRKTNSG